MSNHRPYDICGRHPVYHVLTWQPAWCWCCRHQIGEMEDRLVAALPQGAQAIADLVVELGGDVELTGGWLRIGSLAVRHAEWDAVFWLPPAPEDRRVWGGLPWEERGQGQPRWIQRGLVWRIVEELVAQPQAKVAVSERRLRGKEYCEGCGEFTEDCCCDVQTT